MDVVVFLDQRFSCAPNGTLWTADSCPHSFFRRYLAVFDRVLVVARVQPVDVVDSRWKRASGSGVEFIAIPCYLGPWQYLGQASRVREAAREALGKAEAVILRVPSQIANCVEPALRRSNRPYGVEVVGDPYESYAPGAVRHFLRPLFRRWFRRRLRAQCAAACAAAYVTGHTLQQRYPCRPGVFTTGYSSVELSAGAFIPQPRARSLREPFRLIGVGSLQFPYKGVDLLIEALAVCVREGLDVTLEIVGEGRLRSALQKQAEAEDVAKRVRLGGSVRPGEGVRKRLDQADLFVHASRAEGLPRALIEAMARGLPCIGARAGGVSELLPLEDTVAVGDAGALACKIREVLREPPRMARMSARNWSRAHSYEEDAIKQRREQFYTHLREQTEDWVKSRPFSPLRNGCVTPTTI